MSELPVLAVDDRDAVGIRGRCHRLDHVFASFLDRGDFSGGERRLLAGGPLDGVMVALDQLPCRSG